MYLKSKWYKGVDWIDEPLNDFSWQTLVTMVMNKNLGEFLE
jgi:hypothetical protein